MLSLAQQCPIAPNAARQFSACPVKGLTQITRFDAQPILKQRAQRLGAGVEFLTVDHGRI